MKRDTNHLAFMNYDSLPKFQGSSEIDSSLYDQVFEGEVNCFTLENLYEIFNLEHPAGYKGRSMSVSDVVAVSYTHLTETKKQELFKKVRCGEVRILMGSTQKMGAGTNVQNKIIASHDLDCPGSAPRTAPA